MLEFKKYDNEAINTIINQDQSEVLIGNNNMEIIKLSDKVKNEKTFIEQEVERRYDKDYIKRAIQDVFEKYNFTERDRTIIELNLTGITHKEIADKLGIHYATVSRLVNTPKAKEFKNEINAVRFANTSEKVRIGMQIALDKILELMNDKDNDKRVIAKGVDLMLRYTGTTNPNTNQNVSAPLENPSLKDFGLDTPETNESTE